ncbi:hypothetical protein JL720_8505 [Aureococcus anophagefferens]|nr:hypothetical protein JL720_8505 [Aureococcus anophagefferens]
MWRRWWALVAALRTPHATAVYTVALYRQPADATAGLAFGSQPTAVVYDDSGAVAATLDGSCVVDVSSSPSGQEDLFRNGSSLERFRRIPIVDGYCAFDLVSIDTVGTYTIGVTAGAATTGFAFVVSDAFDVVVGSPHEIVVAGYPSGGTGGEPFGLQPVINVLDVGGNLVSDWSTGSVTAKILDDGELGRYSPNPGAELLPASKTTANFAFGEAQFDGFRDCASPAGSNTVLTDSTSLIVATLTSNPTSSTFISADAAVAVVDMGVVTFSNLGINAVGERYVVSFTLWLYSSSTGTHADSGISVEGGYVDVAAGPPAYLGIITPAGDVVEADIVASLGEVDRRREGDDPALLDAFGAGALDVRGNPCLDGYGREANATLPVGANAPGSLANSTPYAVSTARPTIVACNLTFPSTPGIYAPGTTLVFNVTFDADVEVFEYYVLADQDSRGRPVAVPNRTVLLTPGGAAVYRRAATPTTTAIASINASAVEKAGVILDNARPKINASYGVRPISPNGTYYAGDEIFLEIAFDMAVAIPEVCPPVLGLDSGIGAETFASYYSGTGTKVLTLGVSSSNGYVRRLSDDPLVDADLDLSDVRRHKSLANLSKIKIDGRYPEIIAYGVANRTTSAGKPVHKGNTTRVDDVVTVSVTYNKPVQVFGAPTLTIDAGRDREAVYSGGNASRTIFFEYVVRVADVSSRLGIPASQSEINDGYTDGAFGGRGRILLSSAAPSVAADPRLYLAAAADKSLGSPLSSPAASNVALHNSTGYTVVDGSRSRPTAVKSVTYDSSDGVGGAAGAYGAGDRVTILVEWTDEVLTSSPPTLRLNNGAEAIWIGGLETETWTYMCLIAEADAEVKNLAVARVDDFFDPGIAGYPRTALWCNYSAGCDITDRLGVAANLSMGNFSGNLQLPAGIEIDVTPPQIIDVGVYTQSSTYAPLGDGPYGDEGAWYTVGEIIDLWIDFDRDVSPAKRMAYKYTVRAGDHTQNLTLVGVNDVQGMAEVYLKASALTTRANLSLPQYLQGAMLGANTSATDASATELIVVKTDRTPAVWNVSFDESLATATLGPGDDVTIYVDFTYPVVVEGAPVLCLNANRDDADARYVSGSGTTRLVFAYDVQAGDVALQLDYTDRYALRRGRVRDADISDDKLASIGRSPRRRAPELVAELTLPAPGEPRSLSGASRPVLAVDGTAPRIVKVSPNPNLASGTVFGAGDEVRVDLTFSRPVVVQGTPKLLMETGPVDRYAYYVNGSNSTTLEFLYVVQAGDSNDRLDYFADQNRARRATDTLVLPANCTIKLVAERPVLDADVLLSPPRSVLMSASGTVYADEPATKTSADGGAYFDDLATSIVGMGYVIRYSSSHVSMPGFVPRGASSTCSSAAAKLQAYPLPEVQLLTVGGSASATSEEVQAYGVGVLVQAAVQSFTTYASPGEEVGGTFNLQYSDEDGNLVAASADVPAGIEPMAAAELLMDAYPDLGLVTASREPYDWCACTGAYTWSITFDGLLGTPYVGLLVVDGSSLTGAGATATKVEEKLEGLESLEDVDVSKHYDLWATARTHRVTFSKVKEKSDVDTGTGAAEGFSWRGDYDALGQAPPPWAGAVRGARGNGAGAAYVYQRFLNNQDSTYQWSQEFALRPDPVDYHGENMAFGHALSLGTGGDVVAVGAPYAEDHGVTEQQNVTCGGASRGTFRLGLFGFWTEPIAYNASASELQSALRGAYGGTARLHPTPYVDVEPLGVASICGNATRAPRNGTNSSLAYAANETTVVVTFITPPSGKGLAATVADLPLLSFKPGDDFDGTVDVAEKIEATAMLLAPAPGDRFGASLALDGDDALVGAPGASDYARRGSAAYESAAPVAEAGAVAVLKRATVLDAFDFEERLVATNVLRGDRFGQGSKREQNSQLQRLRSRPFSTRFG